RHRVAARIRNLELDESGHSGAQGAETILAWQHLHERRILEVHQHDIAEKPVRREDVEEQLTGRIGCGVRNDEIDVEVEVAPLVCAVRAARQTQIDTVVEDLVTTIATAVHRDHAEIALVDIFGREEEAVVVGPHGSLNLAPIAGYI